MNHPGREARASLGWWYAHRWLLRRRLTQLGILVLFLLGPLLGIWIVKGNIASSLTLEVLPLSDPLLVLQTLLSGHGVERAAWLGAGLVLVLYLLLGGRAYCAWVCPLNIVTDVAAWLRLRLGIKRSMSLSRANRYWLLGLILLLAALSGTLMWELINPVTLVYRGLIFGMGLAWGMVAAILLFDLFVSRRGWCGHLCPVGAFYSLLGHFSLLRVRAPRREQCNDCMDCYAVCPEPQVIRPALKGAEAGNGPQILSANCTNCGRCIDVCSKQVFAFGHRFNDSTSSAIAHKTEARP
jgi:ferredoxin-type protein NapH